jgi:hypothetical protein
MTEGVFRSGQTGAEWKFGTDVSKQRPLSSEVGISHQLRPLASSP